MFSKIIYHSVDVDRLQVPSGVAGEYHKKFRAMKIERALMTPVNREQSFNDAMCLI